MIKPPNSSLRTKIPLIRASELAHFGFCERAWWLNNVKQAPRQNQKQLSRGQSVHKHHEQLVGAALRWSQIGKGLFAAGAVLLLIALGVIVFG